MLSKAHITRLANRIEFRDWDLKIEAEGDHFILQWRFLEEDLTAPGDGKGSLSVQSGRKWRVSKHSTEAEVVQTALAAALMALEHEAREQFRLDGEAIFGPHLALDTLLTNARNTDHRG